MTRPTLLHGMVPEDRAVKYLGQVPSDADYDSILTSQGKVYTAEGKPLLVYLPGALKGTKEHKGAFPSLQWLKRHKTDNRGSYSVGNADLAGSKQERVIGVHGGLYRKVKEDGSVSRQTRSRSVRSAIIGYFDRRPRHPYCRETAFTAKHVDRWNSILPLCQAVDELFSEWMPERWEVQSKTAAATPAEYVIKGTAFTTLTVNNSVAAGYHRDAGDLKAGFGCMAYFRDGQYSGGLLVFPKHRVAVDVQDGDVLLFNPHDIHGMTPFYGQVGPECEPENGGWSRISVVLYYREKMQDCLPAAQELVRARQHSERLLNREEWT